MIKISAIIVGAFLTLLTSCDVISPTVCTEQFEIISVQVDGATLDKAYTLDANQDTVMVNNGPFIGGDNFYVVLDDSFQERLENSSEKFTFMGYANDSLLVNEVYEIGAGGCP